MTHAPAIIKHLPLPPKGIELNGKQPKINRYPWRTMAPGDAFLFPEDKDMFIAHAAVVAATSRTGRSFTARRVREGEHAGRIAVWRLA